MTVKPLRLCVLALVLCFSAQAAPVIRPVALAKLIADAKSAESDALVVMHEGKIIVEEYFGHPKGPIEAMSATKSVVSMAIGLLIDDGKIKSVEQPVSDFFPEWKQGKKAAITIRHLMNHTSGLQNARNTTLEIYPSADFVKLALSAELSSDPGTAFSYNNKAVNLLAGIIKRAAGLRMDEFLKQRLFLPLGITTSTWTLDEAGNPHGMSGLQIEPADFLKLGQLMLQKGLWKGKRILSEAWIELSTSAGQHILRECGLLWWRHGQKRNDSLVTESSLAEMRAKNVSPHVISMLEPLKGMPRKQAFSQLKATLTDEKAVMELLFQAVEPELAGPATGYSARGFLGQYLLVLPSKKLVAVRMYRGPSDETKAPPETSGFQDFDQDVEALIQ